MIRKITKYNHEYLQFQFKDLQMSRVETVRLYDIPGCKICLEPNIEIDDTTESFCTDCIKGRNFDSIRSLGIYTVYDSYQREFGQWRWSYICSKIRCMKPPKPGKKQLCTVGEKIRIGEILARLLYWLIGDWKIDLSIYNSIIPVPTNAEYNQVDFFGKPFSELCEINYQINLLSKDSSGEYKTRPNSESLKNQNIILLDDVATSTDTIDKCSILLKSLGAENILVLVLARTVEIDKWGSNDFG